MNDYQNSILFSTSAIALIIISGSEKDEKRNIKDMLRKLIAKRPPIEELEKKGIIKGNHSIVFG